MLEGTDEAAGAAPEGAAPLHNDAGDASADAARRECSGVGGGGDVAALLGQGRSCMVGDRLDSDMAFASGAGLFKIHVVRGAAWCEVVLVLVMVLGGRQALHPPPDLCIHDARPSLLRPLGHIPPRTLRPCLPARLSGPTRA